jgi:hypothetical protein
MNLDAILAWLEEWPIGQAVNQSEFWFPFTESVHVLSFAFMVGSIFFVDLRLLGFLGKGQPVRQASRILPFTWAAFAVSAVSGTLMLAPAASLYFFNTAFQWKLVLMVVAGFNMLVFHFGVWRTVGAWNEGVPTPAGAKLAGFISMAGWIGVVIAGRTVPFLGLSPS